jgi:hypothetical protein
MADEEKKDDNIASLPVGPTPEELAKTKREEAIVTRVRKTVDCFCNEEGGVRCIPEDEVGLSPSLSPS